MENRSYCENPWNCLELNNDGKCFFCNPCFSNFNSIGNIFEQDIDEIWNGEKAQQYRKDIIEKKYTFCNYDVCNGRKNKNLRFDGLIAPYPEYINIGYDYTCAQRCIICRDEHLALSKEECNKWESKLETHLIPITSNVKYMFINCRGEFFDSLHTQKMTSVILENNKNIKVEFISNGIKCTEENLIKHKLLDRLYKVHISLHAASRKTYKKIFRVDKYNQVIENIKFISKLRKENKIEDFELMFVITDANYKDMPKFVKLANKYNARAVFSACIGGYAEYITNREEYAVFYQNHHNYNNFVKMLKSPIFDENDCFLPNYLRELKPVPLKQSIKNKIRHIARTIFKIKIEQTTDNISIFAHDTYKE